jgi:hypothetical protein
VYLYTPLPVVTHSALAEVDLEEMATHETQDSKVFQRFRRRTAAEPDQVKKSTVK